MITLPIACGVDGTVQPWDPRYAELVTDGDGLSLLPLAYAAAAGTSNLILNGTFATDTVWTKGASWSISGGRAIRASDVASSILSQPIAFVAGATYRVEFTVLNYVSGLFAARFTGGTTRTGTTRTANGTYSQDLVANTGNVTFEIIAGGGTQGDIDNVSMRRIA